MEISELADTLSDALERLVLQLRDSLAAEPLSPAAGAMLARLHASGPMRVADLTRTQNVSQPAVTQLVARLVDAHLVTRAPSLADRRSVVVHLTGAGRQALEERRRRRARALQSQLGSLSSEQRAAISQALPALEALFPSTPENPTPKRRARESLI